MGSVPPFYPVCMLYCAQSNGIKTSKQKMSTQHITLQLPETVYQSARRVAQATHRPLDEVIAHSLAHTLPPLDDVPEEEAEALAMLSLLDDAQLWHVAEQTLPADDQAVVHELLDQQNAGILDTHGRGQLTTLLDSYNQIMLHKAHAWLLLARRGYQVPPQQSR